MLLDGFDDSGVGVLPSILDRAEFTRLRISADLAAVRFLGHAEVPELVLTAISRRERSSSHHLVYRRTHVIIRTTLMKFS